MRYRELIATAIENGTSLREMAKAMKMSPASMHDYHQMGVEPRLDALRRMSSYFGEPVSVLLSEDDDLTAALITAVRNLPIEAKQQLLAELKQ